MRVLLKWVGMVYLSKGDGLPWSVVEGRFEFGNSAWEAAPLA